MLTLPILSLALAALPALAHDNKHHDDHQNGWTAGYAAGCSLSGAHVDIPAGQTTLTPPSGVLNWIGLGIGTQNYTCANTSTYSVNVALAEVFDISCAYNSSIFPNLTSKAITKWEHAPAKVTAAKIISAFNGNPHVLGQHYYVPNPVTGVGNSPKWDFTSSAAYKGNPNAFAVGAKTGDIPSPAGKTDIDWVQLKVVAGDLATTIYRTDTQAGVPPSSCTFGSSPPVEVRYVAKYWFYGGTIANSTTTTAV